MTTENLSNAPQTSARRMRKAIKVVDEGRRVPSIERIEQRQFDEALQSQLVKDALFAHEGAQLRRDSISRKLCAGSTAVTVENLAHWETELSKTKTALQDLLKDNPLLVRHPAFAAIATSGC